MVLRHRKAGIHLRIMLIFALVLVGCASATVVGDFPEEIGKDETIGVVLLRYRENSGGSVGKAAADGLQSEAPPVDDCVADAIRDENDEFGVVSGAEAWKALFPSMPEKDFPRERGEVLAVLEEKPPGRLPGGGSFRYLVMLEVLTFKDGAKGYVEGPSGGSGGAVVELGSRRVIRTDIQAEIIDLVKKEKSYKGNAYCGGKEGAGCVAGVIGDSGCAIPFVFPVIHSTRTEKLSCEELGKRIGSLLKVVPGHGRPEM